MRYRIGTADNGGSWSAVAFDLPGCMANATDRGELLAIALVAIADHVAWLQRGRLAADGDGSADIDVVEEIRASQQEAADGEFCFKDDLTALTDDEIERAIGVMEWSRADLLGTVRGVPDVVLDWRPPVTAMARIDEWNPQPRTIREILGEIASAESYYRTALNDGAVAAGEGNESSLLMEERALLVDSLRALTAEDRGRSFAPVRHWQSCPEHWTARKVIRRVISHERFHTAEIRQQLSWLLVGVPRFRRQ